MPQSKAGLQGAAFLKAQRKAGQSTVELAELINVNFNKLSNPDHLCKSKFQGALRVQGGGVEQRQIRVCLMHQQGDRPRTRTDFF